MRFELTCFLIFSIGFSLLYPTGAFHMHVLGRETSVCESKTSLGSLALLRRSTSKGFLRSTSRTLKKEVKRSAPSSILPLVPSLPLPSMATVEPILSHVVFWSALTFILRTIFPSLLRLLLPNPPKKMITYLKSTTEKFQSLSPLCWFFHIISQSFASLVASTMRLPSLCPSVRALGKATLLSTIGGGFLLVSHALIGRDDLSEDLLYGIGTKIVRASSFVIGPAILFPFYFIPIFTSILLLCVFDFLQFNSPLGMLLALLSVLLLSITPTLPPMFRLAYALFFFTVPLLPKSDTDYGHTWFAGAVGLPWYILHFVA